VLATTVLLVGGGLMAVSVFCVLVAGLVVGEGAPRPGRKQ
jgi:hypothetical protein